MGQGKGPAPLGGLGPSRERLHRGEEGWKRLEEKGRLGDAGPRWQVKGSGG